MATSNSFSYTETAQTLINDAADFIGYLTDGDSLTPSEYNRCIRQLNRILKEIQARNIPGVGVMVWQRQTGYLFLSTTTGQYTLTANSPQWANGFITTTSSGNNSANANVINLSSVANIVPNTNLGFCLDNGSIYWSTAVSTNSNTSTVNIAGTLPSPMNGQGDIVYVITDDSAQPPVLIDYVNLRNSNGNDLTLQQLTYDQYNALPGKNQPNFVGDPQAVYYEPHLVGNSGRGFGYLRTDVNGTADVTKYLVVNYVRELQDVVNQSDEIDINKELFNAIMLSLAKQIAPSFQQPWDQNQEAIWVAACKAGFAAQPKRTALRFQRRSRQAVWQQVPHR